MAERTYSVAGMSCDHCVGAVKAEVGSLTGVTRVDVDLASGRMTVVSDQLVDDTAVRGAVKEAGYVLTGP